jgi:hypothetical protein
VGHSAAAAAAAPIVGTFAAPAVAAIGSASPVTHDRTEPLLL